ncbi:MAG: DUF4010 domain-containing protein [Thermoprotei archaeon]|nr:DUF4010 domain-containing protein [Thermoprotei archaeon]
MTAAAGGALIGLERERLQLAGTERGSRSLPGVRSFGLISLYGSLASMTSTLASNGDLIVWSIIFSSATLAMALFFSIYTYLTMSSRRAPGITTYVVILVAYIIGVTAGLGKLMEAASVTILATLLLAIKNPAVKLARELKYEELTAIMEIAVLALIIGPIVAAYSPIIPWIDVYRVYIFFLLVLALSLVSYGAARIWGSQGVSYAASLGSFVNSEAMIAGVTRLVGESKASPEDKARTLGVLTTIIIATMHLRASLLALVALNIFTGSLVLGESIGLLVLALISIIILSHAFRTSLSSPQLSITVKSPLSWYTAVKVTITYAILVALFKALEIVEAPLQVFYILTVAGGFVNATAAILGVATSVAFTGIPVAVASITVAIAAATLNKIVYSEMSLLDEKSKKTVITRSLTFSAIPLLISLAYLAKALGLL